MSDLRVLVTKWFRDAWEKINREKNQMINDTFKRRGQYNDIYGRENHLIKVQGSPRQVAPEKEEQYLKIAIRILQRRVPIVCKTKIS